MDQREREHFYRDNADRLYRFCYRLSGNYADAEDIAADCFVKFFARADRIREESARTTYMFRIAVRLWSVHQRRQRLVRLIPLGQQLNQDHDVRLDLDRAIDGLPSVLRVSLILVKAEGMTYSEAAKTLGVPVGTVQSRVFQALNRLKRQLEASGLALEN